MMSKTKKKKKHRLFWHFFRIQLVLLVLVLTAAAYYFYGGYGKQVEELKQEAVRLVRQSDVDTFKANQTSIVYASDGSVISTLKGEKDSYYVSIEEMPVDAVTAIVSIEDKKFFRHHGIDYRALLRAVKAMVQNGEVKQGGSTITMQLARNIFLSQEKTWQRKVEEMYIATELENKYSKDQILEFYLNNIYFGNGYYGIQSAARGYFDRDVESLSLSQIAFLCAIPNNPTLYDPVTNKDNTVSRRDRILKNMLDDGKISQMDYAQAVAEQITLNRPQALAKNDYVETYTYYCATRALMEQQGFVFHEDFKTDEEQQAYEDTYSALYSECQKKLYTGGYRIYTSIDLSMQDGLQQSVNDTLSGYTGVNDEGVYELQASAVCIDNDNGYVRAIVGGRSQEFPGYTLNRAYQSFRQPGSAIKPLTVYTPSFEQNYTPDSIVTDEPIEDTVRTAVEKSVNTIAWKLYDQLTPDKGLSYLKAMNFSRISPSDYRLATALGGFTNGVSALEMASGFATIENDGYYRTPTCIVKIEDGNGTVLYNSGQNPVLIYKKNAARMMTDVLKGVITNGTGKGLDLGDMPCAGKTGTTNDQKDGWFVGYTRYYTTSVWVGYDMPKKLQGLMGNTYPGKIWQSFMSKAHEGLEPLEFLPYARISDDLLQQQESGSGQPEDNPAEETPEEETPVGETPVDVEN
ncbi:MAG: glycosyl transferase [Roseburia inulinivorans]|nr:MAG: glycosyl transferase [Roseburia inulinivorans]